MSVISQDKFFTQVFQTGLSNPGSQAYLPGIFINSTNPNLNPLSLSGIDLGNQSLGNGISVDISLTNLVISGIPNVSVATINGGSLQLTELTIDFTAQFCTLNPPPSGVASLITFACDFILDSASVGQLPGTISVTLNKAALNGVIILSGSSFTDITITITQMTISIPSTVTLTPVVIFNPPSSFFSNAFQSYLKQTSTIDALTGNINTQIAGLLTSLSSSVTNIIRADLRKQIGFK